MSNDTSGIPTSWSLNSLFPWLALIISIVIYLAHSLWGGGSSHLILDSWAYLQISSGRPAGVPFDTRILVPSLAAFIAGFTGLSLPAAFNILTSLALLVSLLILKQRLNQRGSSLGWQTTVLLAFGCPLAVTFGYTPILVDPVLLLVICLTIIALDAGKLVVALILTCIAVLTKEFGLFLGPTWALYAYRRGLGRLAWAGLMAPTVILVIVVLLHRSDVAVGFLGWKPYASHYLFDYQLSVLRLRGLTSYTKLLYMGAWCALWPIVIVATMSIRSCLMRLAGIDVYRIGFVVLLVCLPLLLLGDWSRNLIVLVPFASIVAASHPLASDRYFVGLVAIGGFTTALARPFHGDSPTPQGIVLTVTILSLLSSILIVTKIVRFIASTSRPDARIAELADTV